jgi:hypothetical protein
MMCNLYHFMEVKSCVLCYLHVELMFTSGDTTLAFMTGDALSCIQYP